jgi:hypothetical protein
MMDRRQLLATAMAFGAGAAWGRDGSVPSRQRFQERRDLYPEGVASGDPDEHSVLLWTRRPFADGRSRATLTVELAEDEEFQHVVAEAPAKVSAASDWTCRVLVGGLRSGRVYWYRFSDADGFGSRLGRTITAPARDDPRPVRFAFVSCQNANDGAQNAYRRLRTHTVAGSDGKLTATRSGHNPTTRNAEAYDVLFTKVNMLMRHGARSALQCARTGDAKAVRSSSPSPSSRLIPRFGISPAPITRSSRRAEESCKFACIARPAERFDVADLGPPRYRMAHRDPLWKAGERPTLTQEFLQGCYAKLSVYRRVDGALGG